MTADLPNTLYPFLILLMVLQSSLITSLAAVAARFSGERTLRNTSLYIYFLTSLIVEGASGKGSKALFSEYFELSQSKNTVHL